MNLSTLIFAQVILLMIIFSSSTRAQEYRGHGDIVIPVTDFEGFEPVIRISDDSLRIVNFWATWCIPCVKEMPEFQEARKDLSGKPVSFIFISMDMPAHLESRVIPFIRERNILGQHILLDDPDANSWIPKVHDSWTGAIPATLIFKGKDVFFREGSMTYEEIMTEVEKLQ